MQNGSKMIIPGGAFVKWTLFRSSLDRRASTSFSFCIETKCSMRKVTEGKTINLWESHTKCEYRGLSSYCQLVLKKLCYRGHELLTDIYSTTSVLPTIEADIRFTGSTEYSARAFRIALVCELIVSTFSQILLLWIINPLRIVLLEVLHKKPEIHTDQIL